jgi:hypothetical protein
MAKFYMILGMIWLYGFALLFIIGMSVIWYKSGFVRFLEILSPFNISGWIVNILFASPGLVFIKIGGTMNQNQQRKKMERFYELDGMWQRGELNISDKKFDEEGNIV